MLSYERAVEIANLYYDDIYYFCYSRLKNETYAADVTQEVFLFFQKRYTDLEDKNIKAWLYSVANNKIKESFREIAKQEKERIFKITSADQTTMDILYETEQNNRITDEEINEKKKSILASLTEKELELFELVYTKHMEYSELAKALNISEGAARTKISRLKLKIKEKTSFAFMALLLLFMRL